MARDSLFSRRNHIGHGTMASRWDGVSVIWISQFVWIIFPRSCRIYASNAYSRYDTKPSWHQKCGRSSRRFDKERLSGLDSVVNNCYSNNALIEEYSQLALLLLQFHAHSL